jgi:hypothetical protein
MEITNTRKRQRSPNCPGISLNEALQRGRKVYDEEGRAPAERPVIAKDMGYAGISGASATLIGALRQYGVLESAGTGMRISDDAITVFELSNDSPERIEAIKRMAFAPPLFEELRQQFPERPPREQNLRHILIKKGFSSKQADEVSQAYRDNFELVGAHLTQYTEGGETMKEAPLATPSETVGRMYWKELEQGNSPAQAFTNIGQKLGAPLLAQSLVVSIPRKFVVNVTVQGDEIRKEDLAKIKSQFTRWIEGLEEAFE